MRKNYSVRDELYTTRKSALTLSLLNTTHYKISRHPRTPTPRPLYHPGSFIYHTISKMPHTGQWRKPRTLSQPTKCPASHCSAANSAYLPTTDDPSKQIPALTARVNELQTQLHMTNTIKENLNYLPVPAILDSAATDHIVPPHSYYPTQLNLIDIYS